MSNREAGAALATFSLVFGLLSVPCFWLPIPALPAIFLGHIALGHIGSLTTPNARWRAWAGLLLGYMNIVVFGVLAVLFVIGTAYPSEDIVPVAEVVAAPQQPAPSLPPRADGPDQSDDVYVREGDARYHRFFCSTTGDLDTQRTRLKDAVSAGFRACEVCQSDQR